MGVDALYLSLTMDFYEFLQASKAKQGINQALGSVNATLVCEIFQDAVDANNSKALVVMPIIHDNEMINTWPHFLLIRTMPQKQCRKIKFIFWTNSLAY